MKDEISIFNLKSAKNENKILCSRWPSKVVVILQELQRIQEESLPFTKTKPYVTVFFTVLRIHHNKKETISGQSFESKQKKLFPLNNIITYSLNYLIENNQWTENLGTNIVKTLFHNNWYQGFGKFVTFVHYTQLWATAWVEFQ